MFIVKNDYHAYLGSDLAGETAAAFAAASIVFKKADPTYSESLLKHAKSVYTFADKYRDTYTTEITDAASYYKSWSGYGDELAWSAAWLLRATNDSMYRKEVDKHFQEFSKQAKYYCVRVLDIMRNEDREPRKQLEIVLSIIELDEK